MIATPEGEVAIEALRAGESVLVRGGEGWCAQPVCWVGRARSVGYDAGSFPVRILADAFADGVPSRDVLVTADQYVFVEGRLVPAGLLINGRTVMSEACLTRFDVFQLETVRHSIVLATGLSMASYLDTGDRGHFEDMSAAGTVVRFMGRARRWERDAAAPLGVEDVFLAPVRRWLEARAIRGGFAGLPELRKEEECPAMHLLTENGQVLRKLRDAAGFALFRLPSGVSRVWVRPGEGEGGALENHVFRIGEAMLWDSGGTRVIEACRGEPDLGEADEGVAMLELGVRAPDAIGMIGVRAMGGGGYGVAAGATVGALAAAG